MLSCVGALQLNFDPLHSQIVAFAVFTDQATALKAKEELNVRLSKTSLLNGFLQCLVCFLHLVSGWVEVRLMLMR